jgi:molybdenum cofactor cytidylyltransferase
MPEPRIAAIVLAAGASRRFGGRKQLALLDGRTLLEHVLEQADAAGLRPVVAVVPVWLTRPASASGDLVWVRNGSPELGMSRSLQMGLAALPDDVEAAVVLLGDQPGIRAETVRTLLAARGHTPIVATHAGGRFGPPVLLERAAFGLAELLEGDVGLREVLAASTEVTRVEVPEHAADIDTRADLERLAHE